MGSRTAIQWARKLIADVREDHGEAEPCYGRVFVKQLGSVWTRRHGARHPHGGDWSEWPEDRRGREFPTLGQAVLE